MAFYKCIPFRKEKIEFIKGRSLADSYVRTASYLGPSTDTDSVAFTPNPNGTWATLVFSKIVPAKCKKLKFKAYASYVNCGYVGVSRDPNAKGPGQCVAGYYINNTSGLSAKEIDISAYNEPLYVVVSGYYRFNVSDTFAE